MEVISRGTIIEAKFREVDNYNSAEEYTELLVIFQTTANKYMLFSFVTGNRWLDEEISGIPNSNKVLINEISSKLKSANTSGEFLGLKILGHINEFDVYSFLG